MKKTDVLHFFNNSVNEVANAFGISHSAVSQWGELIPEKQALKASLFTNGKLVYDESCYRKPKPDLLQERDAA
jgi:hypothetical protein